MRKKQSPGSEARVSVISLNDKRIIVSIFKRISHRSAAHEELRRHVFREVAKSTKLQHMFLDVLSKQPERETAVLHELAKNPQLKRKLVVVATKRGGHA